jgi:hypothetical protein
MPNAVLKHHYQVHDVQHEGRPPSSEINPRITRVERTMESNDVLTLYEAATLLRVHPVTLRRRAVVWGVPHRRLGSEWRFSRITLTAWMQERDVA